MRSTLQLDRMLSKWTSQARKGVLELLVMSALSEREYYGYELVEHVATKGSLSLTEGTIYAILARLKTDDLVSTRWQTAERGPPRKYYSLTKKGARLLKSMRIEWRGIVESVEKFEGDA